MQNKKEVTRYEWSLSLFSVGHWFGSVTIYIKFVGDDKSLRMKILILSRSRLTVKILIHHINYTEDEDPIKIVNAIKTYYGSIFI